jgi:hypothetical protein
MSHTYLLICDIASSILYEYRPVSSLISVSLSRLSFVKEFKLFFKFKCKRNIDDTLRFLNFVWWYINGKVWEALLHHVSVWVIRHEDILLRFCLQLIMRIFVLYLKCIVLVLKCFLIVRLQESLLIYGIVCRKNFTRRTMTYWQHCLNLMWRG